MEFDFSPDQRQLKDQARRFLADHCGRDAVRAVLDGPQSFDAALWSGLAAQGYLGAAIPEAYGGLGAGPGAPFTRPDPAPVVGLSNVLEVAMGSGLQHGLARLVDGTVWGWGDNRSGQLGNGTTSTQPVTTPVQVTGLNLN